MHRLCNSLLVARSSILRQGVRRGAFVATTRTVSSQADNNEPFYGSPRPRRRPLSLEQPLDRWQLLLQQASIALRDPTRADAVAAVGELTGTTALQKLQTVMRQDDVGRAILVERPLVTKTTIPYERLLQQAREYNDNTSNNNAATVPSEATNDNNNNVKPPPLLTSPPLAEVKIPSSAGAGISLSPDLVKQVFPYHVVIDEQFQILQIHIVKKLQNPYLEQFYMTLHYQTWKK